jgi:hypothetical protein
MHAEVLHQRSAPTAAPHYVATGGLRHLRKSNVNIFTLALQLLNELPLVTIDSQCGRSFKQSE